MVRYRLKYRGTEFPLTGPEVTLGRSPQHASIVLSGERVSREHAMIRIEVGGLVLRDLHSRNGTFLNGTRVEDSSP